MSWAHPLAFALLLAVPLAFWPLRRRGRTRFSRLAAGFDWAGVGRYGPPLLATCRAVGLALLVLALARPQTAQSQTHAYSEGIAIQLVLDTSLSMGYTDYSLDNQTITRMDAARRALHLFVRGDERKGLPGRPGDLIGLITFNRYPEVACPLTQSHDTLLAILDEVPLGPYTNIGDGLAWGVERIRKAGPRQKVIVLLTDGKHNVREAMDPVEAARLAAELGIRVYVIGAIGNPNNRWRGLTPPPVGPGGRAIPGDPADSVDEPTMRRIAELTGGKYFRATDSEGLVAITKEIDQLEKSKIESSVATRYDEQFPWFLVPGLLVLGLEQLLAATRFLMIPG
jgi:Ca-activated chloride channel family protein